MVTDKIINDAAVYIAQSLGEGHVPGGTDISDHIELAERRIIEVCAAVRKERDAEWKVVVWEAIPLIKGRLEIAKKEKDPYLIKWATETVNALNALIEEVK